jgi:glycosyltransferase involved in cell wall biosynthesis
MRVVIDGRMILPQMSGVGRYLISLSRALRDLGDDTSFELWLQEDLSIDHPARKLAGNNFQVRVLPVKHMSLSGQWQIPFEAARSRADLLHFPHFDLPWATPGRVVATIHDLKYIAHPEFFPQFEEAKRLAMQIMMSFTCRRAQRIICVSKFTAHDLHERLGAPVHNLRVVPHGVDERFFTPAPPDSVNELRQRLHLDPPFILFVGERRPHKNLIGLLKAFALFRRMTSLPYQLVIAGKSYTDYKEPEKIAKQFGLSDSIIFLDYVAEFDLPILYQAAEAFILLSYYEGFGLPILEAMASGTPVLSADRTALPEVVGEAGLLVDPDNPDQAAEALCQIVCGGAQREQMIALGSERARQYTWERCAQKTMEIYREAQNR